MGITSVRFAYNFPRLPVDMSHPRFVLDHNRCVLCTRCVRICAEVEGAHVWEVVTRGIRAPHRARPEPEVGMAPELHQLRQMRAGMPDRRVGRERVKRWKRWCAPARPSRALARRRGVGV